MRPIPGYPHYFADDAGIVWSDRSGIPLAVPAYIAGGYYTVTLRREGGSLAAWQPVHRLVLLAFLGPVAEDMPCFHGRRGIRCNAIDNLRVCKSPCSLTVDKLAAVLDATAKGCSLAETARRCGVGTRTVTRIRQRFGISRPC